MRQAGTARLRNVPHSVKQLRDQPGQERFRMPDGSTHRYATSRPKEKKQLTELQTVGMLSCSGLTSIFS
jgi:hypothetical protein